MSENALVVAACNKEDIAWTEPLVADWMVFIERTYRPPGREVYAYLTFITSYYRDLPEEIVLVQGDPFGHDHDFIAHLSDPLVRWYGMVAGCPYHCKPQWDDNLHSWCDVLGLEKKDHYRFIAGAQYRVTAEQIRSRPLALWKTLLELCEVNPKTPHTIERLWAELFGITL